MKLSINLLSIFKIIDRAIKEAQQMEDKIFICYKIGYLMACKGILYAIWPESAKNDKAYYLIEEKTKEIQRIVDEICRMAKQQ
ncbi:MAG: hypothetical protein GX054_09475 [Clostridiales bacterium]|nr:hypothetical protein [Clostridiales bacterium]